MTFDEIKKMQFDAWTSGYCAGLETLSVTIIFLKEKFNLQNNLKPLDKNEVGDIVDRILQEIACRIYEIQFPHDANNIEEKK